MVQRRRTRSTRPSAITLLFLAFSPSSVLSAASYAPSNTTTCSPNSLTRTTGNPTDNAQTLSSGESTYNSQRASVLAPQWQSFYSSGPGAGTGYSAAQLAPSSDNLPRFGIAVSGGGYRAALFGAGVIDAFDNRNPAAVTAGTGGYLQLASYLTGLSGGSWFVSSLAAHNWPRLRTLVQGTSNSVGDGWNFDIDLSSPDVDGVITPLQYLANVVADLMAKARALPNSISIVDAWGRYIAYHFAPGTTRSNFAQRSDDSHGAGLQWADSIKSASQFTAGQVPIPIAVSDAKPEGFIGLVIPPNVTVYEFNPFEFGSFDPTLSSFVDITYLGTPITNGRATAECVTDFSSFSFVVGCSGNIFNFALSATQVAITSSPLWPLLQAAFAGIGTTLTISGFDLGKVPNPFQGVKSGTYEASSDDRIGLIDGGWNGENIPFNPLLVKARKLDTVIALDAGGDPTSNPANHPDGTAVFMTKYRSNQTAFMNANGKTFPDVPLTKAAWQEGGYHLRPTFFGCSEGEADVPLLLYLPNSPYPYASQKGKTTSDPTGTSFGDTTYSDSQVGAFLDATFTIATRGFPTDSNDVNAVDSQWGTCMACAVSERARVRAKIDRSDQCTSCFKRYCYGDIGTGKAGATVGGGSNIPKGSGSGVAGRSRKVQRLAVGAVVAGAVMVSVGM